jgi:hypothetical protein
MDRRRGINTALKSQKSAQTDSHSHLENTLRRSVQPHGIPGAKALPIVRDCKLPRMVQLDLKGMKFRQKRFLRIPAIVTADSGRS